MDSQQADQIADRLVQDAKARGSERAARIVQVTGMLLRFYTGVVTLTAAGGGFVAAQLLFSSTTLCVACGTVCGLIAAVVWSPTRPHGQLFKRQS